MYNYKMFADNASSRDPIISNAINAIAKYAR